MIFKRYREWRRRRLLARPFPPAWTDHIDANFGHYPFLTGEEQRRLRDLSRIFIAEKFWEGCGGLTVTEEMKITVAVQACLLILHLQEVPFPNVRAVLIYPTVYRHRHTIQGPDGVMHVVQSHRLGEAWPDGPVVLSWRDVLHGGQDPHDGRNLVFHEFAHKLDMADGYVDGMPRLQDETAYPEWVSVFKSEYALLVERTRRGEVGVLDPSGSQDFAEFFAIATEAFFELPLLLREWHPRLYDCLRCYFRQDPAARIEAAFGTRSHLVSPSLPEWMRFTG